jgi:guanylate kinase
MREGKIIVIVAPSGTGKSTMMKFIHQAFPQLQESISTTTRKPRTGEQHGVHYFFESEENFKKMIEEDAFLEWAIVHSHYYGTSKQFVEDQMGKGIDTIFDIDVQGADSLKKYFGEKAHVIFIEPPSIEVLRERLRKRATDSEEVIAERIKNAEKELARKNDYDFCIMNDDLETAKRDLLATVKQILDGEQ